MAQQKKVTKKVLKTKTPVVVSKKTTTEKVQTKKTETLKKTKVSKGAKVQNTKIKKTTKQKTEIEKNRQKKLKLLFIQGAFFSLSTALLSYTLSSYLAQYISDKYVSLIYSISYGISFVLTIYFGKIIKKIGLFKSAIFNVIIMISMLLLQMIIKQNIFTVFITIIAYQVTASMMYVFLDYYIEKYSLDGSTGNTKGLQWTVMNGTFLLGPLVSGIVLDKLGFNVMFLLSIITAIPVLWILIKDFKNIKVTATKTVSIKLNKIVKNNAVFKISIINFVLNLFYCIMSIYSGIYMNKVLDLTWDKIGIILAIILIPFVIFQYPAGKIADKYLGQKELLLTSIIVTGVSTICLFFARNVITFTIALFTTRIGASVMEIMRDVHFYKNVDSKNLDFISFFKSMSSFGYIIGPIIASITLSFLEMKYLFLVLGIFVLVVGLVTIWNLKDTKVNFKSKFIEM